MEINNKDIEKVTYIIKENKDSLSEHLSKAIKKGTDISGCSCLKCGGKPDKIKIWRYRNLCFECANRMSMDERWRWHYKYG